MDGDKNVCETCGTPVKLPTQEEQATPNPDEQESSAD